MLEKPGGGSPVESSCIEPLFPPRKALQLTILTGETVEKQPLESTEAEGAAPNRARVKNLDDLAKIVSPFAMIVTFLLIRAV